MSQELLRFFAPQWGLLGLGGLGFRVAVGFGAWAVGVSRPVVFSGWGVRDLRILFVSLGNLSMGLKISGLGPRDSTLYFWGFRGLEFSGLQSNSKSQCGRFRFGAISAISSIRAAVLFIQKSIVPRSLRF